jgi:hypothetical protein
MAKPPRWRACAGRQADETRNAGFGSWVPYAGCGFLVINRGAEPVRLGAIAINTAARQKHSPPSLKLRRATFAEQRLACQPKRHRSRIYPRSLLFNTKSATADLVCREGWCRRRDLNPRPPAYEMKNRNVSAVYGDVLRGARICVRTRFATHQIFCHDRISAYSWELGRTAHETGDCNHAVTRKSAAPAFVRFRSIADKCGFWPAMVCPLMTQSGHSAQET